MGGSAVQRIFTFFMLLGLWVLVRLGVFDFNLLESF